MKKTFKKSVSCLLVFLMVLSIFTMVPFTAFAANDYTINSTESTDDYYNLISKKDWDIAPGITESEIVLNNDAGSRRQVLFVMEADLNNEYVKVINSYNGMIPQYGSYKTGVMSEQAAYAEANGYGNIVGAMNTTLSWYTGYPSDRVYEPLGFIMLDAKILFDPGNCGYEYGNVGFPSVVVINKDFDEDGNPRPADIPKVEMPQIRSAADLDGWEEQVIPCSSGYIVKDGKNQATAANHSDAAPRSVVGIKPDGTVVIMLNDGRQAPYSTGMSMYELAEVMLDLGCSFAVNCDGGGSSTYLSQRPSEELKVNNSPSDGAERETTTGIFFISTAPATGEFVRANISSEHDYYTPNSVVEFTALGSDLVGTEAEIPADAVWQLADPSFGTIENGVFTSTGKQGEVTVQLVYNGSVVGEDTINIVMPDKIEFSQANMVIPFDREVEITINATYDSKPVCIKTSDVEFVLSNNALGTLNGFKFTSAPEGTDVEPGTLTATIGELTIVANISLGKGTEVLYDFEDGNIDNWTIVTNYPQYGPLGSKKDENGNYYYNGQNELGYLSVVDASTGKVRNGNYALAVETDFTQIYETGFHALNMRFPKIDTTDAVAVGFWMYVPFDARFSDVTINSVLGEQFFADGSAMELCEGWHYLKLNAPSAADGFYGISFSVDERASATDANGNSYYDYVNTPNLNIKATFYVDDISIDYSTAVDDRENPVFSKPMVMDSVGSVNAEINGQTINFNNPTFEVKVSDFAADNATGINASSAKAYIDGKEVACTFANGKISINGLALSDGVHTVKFEIADNAGNSAWVGGKVNVAAGAIAPGISVVPKDPDADRLTIGSLYWLDVVAAEIEKVDNIEMVFDINNASNWALEGMTVADGFAADWSVQKDDNIATIKIVRTGEATEKGEGVIASIPVRTWESHITEYEGYENQTPDVLVKRGIIWAQSIEIALEKGIVNYVDKTTDTFGMNDILVDTELFFTNYSRKQVAGAEDWKSACVNAGVGFHVHTVTTLEDKEATCTKTGYTDRTFCEVCNSVVDWGNVVDVLGHNYEMVDDKLTCTNGGELFNGIYTDGKTYVDGVVVADGWNEDNTSYYVDGVKLTGSHIIDKAVYTFDDNGVYMPDHIYNGFITENGETMYFYTNTNYEKEYLYVNDAAYYFVDGVAKEGTYIINGESCFFEGGKFISCSTASVMDAGWESMTVTYIIYSDGSMILGGEGATYKYTSRAQLPWYKFRTKVTSIFVGKEITSLGHYALADIYYTKSITFEEGSKLNYIGAGTFLSCYGITEIVLPDSLQTIVQNSFKMCKNLEDVYLPSGVKYLNKLTFVNNQNVVMPKIKLHVYEGTYAESYAKEYNIPYEYRVFVDSVIASGTCGTNATWEFYKSGKMVISGSGAMDNYASKDVTPWADYLTSITSVEIGKDITEIGNYAFAYATNIESVTFEEGSKLEKIGAAAFLYMVYTTEVDIPESVTFIGNLSFAYCSRLNKVIIPQNVTLIYPQSFKKSANVVLNVAEGTYAESYAKTNAMAYETRAFVDMVIAEGTCGADATWTLYASGKMVISGSGAMDNYASKDVTPWADYLKQIKDIVIGKDITTVGNYAFAYATNTESLTFEEGSKLEKIGAAAFLYMVYTTEVVIPDTVTLVGNLSFAYCSRLEKVVLPQNATLIYPQSFKKSDNVVLSVAEGTYSESYVKTNNMTYETRPFVDMVLAEGTCGEEAAWTLYASGKMVISGSGAMDNYKGKEETPWADYLKQIKDIVIGKDITIVGNYAFAYATNTKSLTFEEGSKLERIGSAAFIYMGYTKEVVLPDTVTYIGNSAFAYCSKLTSIEIPESVKTMFNRTFYKSAALTITVASGSYAESFAITNGVAYTVK